MFYVFDAASNMKRYLALRSYCTILQTDWPGSTETHMARGSIPPLAICYPCSWESTAKTSGNRARTLETHNPDIIALGSKGLTAIESFIMSGVAERVARYADCSVLIGRTPG